MISGLVQNSTSSGRSLAFHISTTTMMPISANRMLMEQCCRCLQGKEGPARARFGFEDYVAAHLGELSARIACSLALPFRMIFKSFNSTVSSIILNLTNLRVSETRTSFHGPKFNSIHLGSLSEPSY